MRDIGLNHHSCLLFDSEEERLSVVVPFLIAGVVNDDVCFFVSAPERLECATTMLRNADEVLARTINSGMLRVVSFSDFLDSSDEFARFMKSDSKHSLKRVAIDMFPSENGVFTSKDAIEREAAVCRRVEELGCPALCMYDRRVLSSDALLNVLRKHSNVIYHGETREHYQSLPLEDSSESVRKMLDEERLFGFSNSLENEERPWSAREQRHRRLLSAITNYTYTVYLRGGERVSAEYDPGCVSVTGRAPEEFSADPNLWTSIVFDADRLSVMMHVGAVIDGQTVAPIEYRIIHADGSTRWVREIMLPLYDEDGNAVLYDGVVVDITARREAEDALRKAHDDLERRVEERTADLQRLNERLVNEVAERRRAEKSLSESHERFRTVVESTDAQVYVVDIATDVIIFANRSAERAHGSLEGRNCWAVFFREQNSRCVNCDNEQLKLLAGTDSRMRLREGWDSESNRWYEYRTSVVRWADGRWVRLIIATDITKRKEMEKALQTSKDRYRNLVEGATDIIYETDMNGVCSFVNPAAEKMIGYSSDEIVGSHFSKFVDHAAHKRITCAIMRQVKSGLSSSYQEFVAVRKDGSSLWMGQNVQVIFENGQPIRCEAVARDITQRRQAELALRESEELTRHIIDINPASIFIKDNAGRYILVNRAACEMFGKSREEVIGRTNRELMGHSKIALEDGQGFDAVDKLVISKGEPQMIAEERFSKWDGSIHWLQTLKAPIELKGNPNCILGVSMNVTERKRNAERQVLLSRVLDVLNQPKGKNETIREVAQLVKEHFEFAAVGIRFQDRADYPYYVALGFPEDFVEDDKHLFSREDNGALRLDENGVPVLQCVCGVVLGGREIVGVGVKTGYGSFWTNDCSKTPLSLEIGEGRTWGDVLCARRGYKSMALIPLRCGGHMVGLLQLHDPRENQFTPELIEFLEGIAASVGVALTRIAVEEALRVTDTAIASASGGIGFADLRGRVTSVNKACLNLWGYSSQDEILGKGVDSFWCSKEDLARVITVLVKNGHWVGELTARKKDGTPMAIHASVNMVTNKDGKIVCVMGSFTDLTTISQLKAQLTRSERLAATGKLAASVAHQINSPLQAIAVLLGALRDRLPDDPVFNSNVELLHGAFNSIRDIVRNLLDLSRPARARKEPANINNAIRKTASLVRAHLDESNIKLALELDDELPPVLASSEELGQVFLNLINNAMEAITDPPKRKGKRKPATNEHGVILVRSMRENGYVVITVADNGPGIAAEDLEHVFDPFYTMKKKMGIGMGLFICHSIVENHNGTIEVENAPEGGAVFTIHLPAEKF